MKVSDYLKPECCIMNLEAEGKDEAIRELVSGLFKAKAVADLEKFVKDILEREELGSTGIGHNIAIPHARTSSVKGFVIGFGRSKKGIDFKSIDGQDVNLIFLMGADPKELNLYLRLLAELSKLLMNHSFRKELMSVEKGEDIVKVIKKYEEA